MGSVGKFTEIQSFTLPSKLLLLVGLSLVIRVLQQLFDETQYCIISLLDHGAIGLLVVFIVFHRMIIFFVLLLLLHICQLQRGYRDE